MMATELRNDCFDDRSQVLWMDKPKIIQAFDQKIEKTVSSNLRTVNELSAKHN